MKYPDDFINKIICGDCLEVMKQMPDKCVDLVLTDPPYGINIQEEGFGRTDKIPHTKFIKADWDSCRPERSVFSEILRAGKEVVIFGGNYFSDLLPPVGSWLVWDKRCGVIPERTYADLEMAWTNLKTPARMIRYIWDGMLQGNMALKEKRVHPTQKPAPVIKMILEKFTKKTDIIFDPFLGSGTTAVACKELNRDFIGVEINPEYCAIAEKRLQNTQGSLF